MTDSLASLEGSDAIITGVSGFLGRALAARLEKLGARVTGIDLAPAVSGLAGGVEYFAADMRNLQTLSGPLTAVSQRSNGDAVLYHLAGMAHVGTCQEDPIRAFELNAMGTVNVLEAARRAGLRRIVVPSTALVYGAPQRSPIGEDDLPSPVSIYGASKLAAEAAVQGYAASYGFAGTIARLGNVYGQRTPVDSVVSILTHQARGGGPLSVRTLSPVRDFIHRDDVVEALMRLGHITRAPGYRVINVSSGVATSIRNVADAICRAAKLSLPIEESAPDSGKGDGALLLKVDRLREFTGWQPTRSLAEGVAQTLAELGPIS